MIATEFATVLGDREGPLVSTAEHVLAALRGMGVDNATIEIDGPEVPIMDGSAAAFVAAIDQAGIVAQPVTQSVAPGGTVVLAGLLETQANAVTGAYEALGLTLRDRGSGEWPVLVLTS